MLFLKSRKLPMLFDFGDKLFKTVIHRNVRLGEAPSYGKPALLYDANSVGTQDYMQLIEEIIGNGH